MNKLTDFLDSVGGTATGILGAINPPRQTTVVQQPAPAASQKTPVWIIAVVIGGAAIGLIWVLSKALKNA